jgi:hypothetical protein
MHDMLPVAALKSSKRRTRRSMLSVSDMVDGVVWCGSMAVLCCAVLYLVRLSFES